jgi:pilus assembly protein CpaE
MSALTGVLKDLQPRHTTPPREGGSLIVFLSAKGGTGTSSLCANLAMGMAEEQPQARLVVVDLVLPIGSIAGIVGYEGDQNVVSLSKLPPSATTIEFLQEDLPMIPEWGFHLLAGSPDPELGNELDVMRIEDIVLALQQAYDHVVIDLGRSLSRISLPLIQRADLLAMIVAADTSTVTLSRSVWEFLQQGCAAGRDVPHFESRRGPRGPDEGRGGGAYWFAHSSGLALSGRERLAGQ